MPRSRLKIPPKPTFGWGGARKGAGRPPIPGRRRPVPHRARQEHDAAHPVHVTVYAVPGLPSLREPRLFEALLDCIRAGSRPEFRIVHFSVQADHLQMVVEAQDAEALSSGARGISIRIARRLNSTLGRRGRLWGDRYQTRELKTPQETRQAIVDVLMSFRKHQPDDRRPIDPCSSAPWFDGFRMPVETPADPPPTRKPRTRLAATEWRRLGLIGVDEAPKTAS